MFADMSTNFIMETVLITGGTGLVGRALCQALVANGYAVIILTRDPGRYAEKAISPVSYAAWNPDAQTLDENALSRADYIIHLAGAGVAEKRWTKARKQEIRDSRVTSGNLLVKALRMLPQHKIKALISASAIGWYGADRQPAVAFSEYDPPAGDFLGETCRLWEASVQPATDRVKRLAIFRIGIVLSPEGGALKEFIKPFRLGVAAILGTGKQTVSWIHIHDMVQLFLFALKNENIAGVFNAVAPAPVTNRELILQLAAKRNRFYLPVRVPSFLLRAVLGEMSVEILKSTRVSADRIAGKGFQFSYPNIEKAADSWF